MGGLEMDEIRSDSDEQSQLYLDHELGFTTLTGDTLFTSLKRIGLTVTDGRSTYDLTLEVQWTVYQEMIECGWMGLHPIARDDNSKVDFEENQPIELQVVLRFSLLKVATRYGPEVESFMQALLQVNSEESAPLRNSESWLVTAVKQSIAMPEELEGSTLKKGYHTIWSTNSWGSQTAPENYNNTLNEIVEQFLDELDMHYEWIEETILRMTYTGDHGSWIILIRTDEQKQLCIVYSIYPVMIPEEYRTGLAVFLIEENYDLTIGSFELDTADGELRFRTSIDVENDRLTSALFGQLFTTNVVIMDQYFEAIQGGME
jgi:hypothetical protein